MSNHTIINSAICDTRSMNVNDYINCEHITINADVLIVSEESAATLASLPVTIHAEDTITLKENEYPVINPVTLNGSVVIGPGTSYPDGTFLSVNGPLRILSGAEEALRSLLHITVNGPVSYPENLSPYLKHLRVNGPVTVEPAGYTVLDARFEMDRYFPLRTKQDARYYAKKYIVIADPATDVAKMTEKNNAFRTDTLIIEESLVEQAIAMFNEEVKLLIMPAGYAFVQGDITLTGAVLTRFGTKLYVCGKLTITDDSLDALKRLSGLIVEGDVSLQKRHLQAFEEVHATYRNLLLEKEKTISGELSAYCDRKLLLKYPGGICYDGVVSLTLDEAITPEEILEHLSFNGCVKITCAEAQKSAVSAVANGVVKISTKKSGGNNTTGTPDKNVHISVHQADSAATALDSLGDILSRYTGNDVADKIKSGLSFLNNKEIVSAELFKM